MECARSGRQGRARRPGRFRGGGRGNEARAIRAGPVPGVRGHRGRGQVTQLPLVERRLGDAGVRTFTTREPGGSPLGESLRAVLLDPRFTGMSPAAELLVMFAARAEHLAKVIEPALAAGTWVLCDRFTDATFAYQGGGRGVDAARIAVLEETAQGGLRPDLVLVLDVPVEVGLARAGRRRQMSMSFPAPAETGLARGVTDRFEREDADFFRRVREVYLERARARPERYAIIDASADEDTTAERVLTAISERFPYRRRSTRQAYEAGI